MKTSTIKACMQTPPSPQGRGRLYTGKNISEGKWGEGVNV